MSNLREPSGDFGALMEVRLLRWGESSTAGRTITLELHPDEGESHPFKAFKSGKDGQRFWMVLRPIADDETPIPVQQGVIHTPDSVEESVLDGRAKTGPQRGCGASAARDRYAVMSSGEKAVVRAAMLPKDERFRAWATEQFSPDRAELIFDEDAAAEYIRERCCDGHSRKRIATEPECMDRFQQMLTEFMIAVGELPEPR